MDIFNVAHVVGALVPAAFMVVASLLPQVKTISLKWLWRAFAALSCAAILGVGVAAVGGPGTLNWLPVLQTSTLGLGLAALVQLLGWVIGAFSARYLEGEAGQRRYVSALAGVLGAVHVLLMADHWLVLIAAWALVGAALQHLLCFYADRPFALLAAHKKRIADRIADALLIAAAALAWSEVGSGSLSALWTHVGHAGISNTMQLSAVLLVLAAILRTALLPVHGWLIQVMEAPTPVSALLHAGVVNLGGFVLIRFAPLLEQATVARWLLVGFGLATAVLAGLVMLTRISIKVRLAWSTVAQMGFMVLECGLGLYTLAALHLVGHSLYKAHAFLSASMAVQQTRMQTMHSPSSYVPVSLLLAPVLAIPMVWLMQTTLSALAWPWWWSAVLGLAWAPLLWIPTHRTSPRALGLHGAAGGVMIFGLTGAALLVHALPLGIVDAPHHSLGAFALLGMAGLYLCLVIMQLRPESLRTWRRMSYAGFYVDEIYTRLALQLWPTRWTPDAFKSVSPRTSSLTGADAAH